MSSYEFGDDREVESRRLSGVEDYADPASRAVLRELGVDAGWRCWEVGAGNGSMAYWLADLVGPQGGVLATDIDIGSLQSRAGLEVVRHDIVEDDLPDTAFDLVHARFLLEHLPEPDLVMSRLATTLRPGGLLVVEDSDGLDLLIDPAITGSGSVCRAWERVASSVSWNPGLGRDLISGLTRSGLTSVQGVSYRRKAPGGLTWEATRLGLLRLRRRVEEEGAGEEPVSLMLNALNDPAHTITGAPVAIAWGTSA